MTAAFSSPLGSIVLEAGDDGLCALRFADAAWGQVGGTPAAERIIAEACRWLEAYFDGHELPPLPPLAPRGTRFQLAVWQSVATVAYGHTVSYSDIGRRVGCRSARAVGQAVGRNPIAILIPCHRVVGAHGAPTGYAYGLDRKLALLRLEQQRGR